MTYPWYSSYPEGVPHEIDEKQYNSIVDLIDQSYEKYAAKPAFHCMGKTFTYAEIDELSKKFASYLQNDLGLKKGSRVALMMPNILQYPIALFGALRAGMVAVNVNPLYTERELEHQMKDAGVEAIIIFENSAHILQKVIKNTNVKHVITTGIGDLLGFPKSLIVNFVIKHVKKMVPAWSLPGSVNFRDALAAGDASKFKRAEMTLSDTAFLQYTGGTTGVAKGAELTHGNIVANMVQARTWIGTQIKEGEEIIITPLPLYHIFSLTANCFVFSSIGALNVLITNPRDIPGFVKELSKWKFTAFTGVNTLYNALLNNEDFRNLDLTSLKLALGGGMAVQKAVADEWKKVTKSTLVEAYGLTETSPAACINPLDIPEYNGTIGVPISSTIVKILDDEGKEVAQGEPGELAIKGPQVMRGYWNRPEETANVMTSDGFFKTGDIAVMTEKGFFKIVDRKKDMILVSGFNVYPNEVEDAVVTHPGILEAAAIGVPNDKSGEIVKLFVVKKDKSLTEDLVIEHCRSVLTGYKVPKIVEFREELPKTNVGKILRKDLRNEELAKMKQ
ncbi:MAG: long-chain-fatty-acid--CoA ligase [Halobacteriovoraceae bacterium]|nr:long-chain-fatty-acid--CoA ligase [Halobacteriovoraceae bacterium]|tara:strand:- start:3401 stop:5083 length:1683 start_codon:yes stop_codon:yes gene_type:complete